MGDQGFKKVDYIYDYDLGRSVVNYGGFGGGRLSSFGESIGDTGERSVSGYFKLGDGKVVNLNPLKNIGTSVANFLTNELKVPVVNFNPLQLFGAGEFLAQKKAGDFQITEGLINNPFLGAQGKQLSEDSMVAWFRSGGVLGAKGKVGIFGAESGRLLPGEYRPILRDSDSMFASAAKLAAGSARTTSSGTIEASGDSRSQQIVAKVKRGLNFDPEQPGSLYRFGQRLLNRKFDINNEAVMAKLQSVQTGEEFTVGGFGRRKTLKLLEEQITEPTTQTPVGKYTLVDAKTDEIVAGHSELMRAFTSFANTTLEQGTGRTVNEALLSGPLAQAAERLNAFQSLGRISQASEVQGIVRAAKQNLEEELAAINTAIFDRRPDDEIQALIRAYDARSTAFTSRIQHFEGLTDLDLASQSRMYANSPSIVTKMDEFKSELVRYLMTDEAVEQTLNSGDPAQIVAQMSLKVKGLISSGKISSTEAAEAQSAILSSVYNTSAFTTYNYEIGSSIIGGQSVLRNPAARFAEARRIITQGQETKDLLDPFVSGSISRARTSKYSSPISALSPIIKRNLGSASYQFRDVPSSISGDSPYTFAPTFATAFARNPKATMLSAAGIKTYGNEEGFSLGSVPLTHAFERLNRPFSTLSAGVESSAYSGPLSMYATGLAAQRVLPALAVGTTALAADRILGGIVNERDQQGNRVYSPLVTTGAARVAVEAQAMMSGITPGGMDYSEKKKQLLEGEVAIRQGRFWLLGNTPFKGGKIQYFRPSWFRRIEGASQFTEDTYGNPIEKLMYYNDFSPLRPLDPYRFERKHYQDRPYPLTGEYFSGPFGPVTPLLNATVGRVLKPQKAMHVEEVTQALASSQPAGDSGAYIPKQIKNYARADISQNPFVSYPAAAPRSFGGQGLDSVPIQSLGKALARITPLQSTQNAEYVSNAGAMQTAQTRARNQLGMVNRSMSMQAPSRISMTQPAFGPPAGPGVMPERIVPAGMPIRSGSSQYLSGELGYRMQETAGIYGFMTGNLRSSITGGSYDFVPDRSVLQSASKAYGSTRAFWDLNLGGLGDVPLPAEGALGNIEISEVVRRFIPKERTNVDFLNPITNSMGRQHPYLPGNEYYIDFTRGDPFTKVPEGEMRLPGIGYERFNKLYSDKSGKYGLVNQYDILADVAPYSKEFRAVERRINNADLSQEELLKVQQVRSQREAQEESKQTFKPYYVKPRNFLNKVFNPIESTKEKLLHNDNFINNKFIGERSPTEDWEIRNVYGATFPEWQRPIESYVKPMYQKSTQRNPLLAATIGAVGFAAVGKGVPARVALGAFGALSAGGYSLSQKVRSDRYIPKTRRKELALEEYVDILSYVKYSTASQRARQAGDMDTANQYMKMSQRTMYGANLDSTSIDQLSLAIPKRKREHFKAMIQAPPQERKRILSTAGRLERRIYEAAWGMKVESRPNLDEYFQDRELPDASWEGWHPNTNMDHVKIKMGQAMGLEMSQMGYYPQQVKEANLTNPSYPTFGNGIRQFGDRQDVRRKLQELMNNNNLNGKLIPLSDPYNSGSINISAGIR